MHPTPRWPDPELSAGDLLRKHFRESCWEAIGAARALFINQADEDIGNDLLRFSEALTHKVLWSIYMIGRTKKTSDPVIMFWCKKADCKDGCRKKTKKNVGEGRVMLKYPGFRLGDCKWPPDFKTPPVDHAGDEAGRLSMGHAIQVSNLFFGLEGLQYLPLTTKTEDGVTKYQIRVLVIESGELEDPLTTYMTSMLDTQDLNIARYAWVGEDSGETKTMRIGLERFEVPADLRDALKALRNHGQNVHIWLDVLCIDPDNEDEIEHPYVSIRRSWSEDRTRQSPVLGIQGFVHNLKSTQQTPSGNASWSPQLITLGGLVEFNEDYLCLTAAHAFEAARDPSHESSSVRENDFEWSIGEEESTDDLGIGSVDTTSRGSTTPEQPDCSASTETVESLEALSVTPTAQVEETRSRQGSASTGIHAEEGPLRAAELKNFESELREVVGHLTFSSLEEPASDLDYALIGVPPFQLSSLIASQEFRGHDSISSREVALAMPKDNCKVIVYSGSLGPIEGTMSATPTVMLSPSQLSKPFQEFWTVRLNGKLSIGDSGSWVVEADSGNVLGHIISSSPDTGVAYIVPMKDIFKEFSESHEGTLQLFDKAKFPKDLAAVGIAAHKEEIPRNVSQVGHLSPLSPSQENRPRLEDWEADPVSPPQGEEQARSARFERLYKLIGRPSKKPFQPLQAFEDDGPPAADLPIRIMKSPLPNRHPNRTRVRSPRETIDELTQSHGTKKNIIVRRNTYEYTPLARRDDLRIFRLFPGQGEDRIEGALFPAAMSTTNYEAVTYEWGSPDIEHEISILSDDLSFRGTRMYATKPASLYIRSNLYSALQVLRDPQQDVYLWIDAICVDISSTEELSKQASEIGEIFRNAERVLVWLGNPSTISSSKAAFHFSNQLCDMFDFDDLLSKESDGWVDHWWDLAMVMKDSLFSRRWVIHEIALANQVILYSGKSSLNWDDFADAVALFATKFDQIRNLAHWKKLMNEHQEPFEDISKLPVSILVDTLRKIFRRGKTGKIVGYNLSLEELMVALTPFQTSDLRDTIYALLPLARDTDRRLDLEQKPRTSNSTSPYHKIKPRYNQDLVEVCKELVDSSIKRTKSLDIICRHWAPERMKDLGLPSWMPTVIGGAFSRAWQISTQRSNGDSLVGPPGHPIYRASAGMLVDVVIGGLKSRGPGLVGKSETWETTSGIRIDISEMRKDSGKARSKEEVQSAYLQDPRILAPNPFTEYRVKLGPRSKWLRAFDTVVERIRLERVSNNEDPFPNIAKVVLRRIQQTKHAALQHESIPFDGRLGVKGTFISQIETVTARCASGTIPEEALRLGGWIPASEHDEGDDLIPDDLWQTLVAGRDHTGERSPQWYRRAFEHVLKLADTGSMRDINTNTLIETCRSSPIIDFLKRIRDIVWNRKLFTTADTSWKLGLGPPQMQKGDLIFVLFGCSVPVVLRETKESPQMRFKLIGECYVHGMMDGEVMEWATSANRAETWVTLI